MSATTIEWTDVTWNPVRGCSRVSEGCRNCYAERQAARFVKSGQPFHGFAKVTAPRDGLDRVGGRRNGWTGKVELIASKLNEPLHWKKPRRVFVNSMSDLFHERLSLEDIAAIFAVMSAASWLDFQVLTKRPQRMVEFYRAVLPSLFPSIIAKHGILTEWNPRHIDWPPPNVWLGVSVEDQATADERIPLLLQTPAAVRFVSYEPALGPVDFRRAFGSEGPRQTYIEQLDWLIIGGESGPGARPCDIAWIRSAVAQCREAGVACFYKQGGASNRCEHSAKGGCFECFPIDLQVREFPYE